MFQNVHSDGHWVGPRSKSRVGQKRGFGQKVLLLSRNASTHPSGDESTAPVATAADTPSIFGRSYIACYDTAQRGELNFEHYAEVPPSSRSSTTHNPTASNTQVQTRRTTPQWRVTLHYWDCTKSWNKPAPTPPHPSLLLSPRPLLAI